MVYLKVPDDDLLILAERILKRHGFRNIQDEFVDRQHLTIAFPDADEALKAEDILKRWRINASIPEEDSTQTGTPQEVA